MEFPKSKVTIKCDESDNIIAKYSSMNECASKNNIPPTTLYKAIIGGYPIRGYYYKYKRI